MVNHNVQDAPSYRPTLREDSPFAFHCSGGIGTSVQKTEALENLHIKSLFSSILLQMNTTIYLQISILKVAVTFEFEDRLRKWKSPWKNLCLDNLMIFTSCTFSLIPSVFHKFFQDFFHTFSWKRCFSTSLYYKCKQVFT